VKSAQIKMACMLFAIAGAVLAKPALAKAPGFVVSDPFAYCERAGTDDRLSGAASAPSDRAAKILEPYSRTAFGLPAGAPIPAGSLFWRCMQGKVYVCVVGANLPCGAKADRAKRNSGAEAYCRENPGADRGTRPAWLSPRPLAYDCQVISALVPARREASASRWTSPRTGEYSQCFGE
jgi:hypothetical protein